MHKCQLWWTGTTCGSCGGSLERDDWICLPLWFHTKAEQFSIFKSKLSIEILCDLHIAMMGAQCGGRDLLSFLFTQKRPVNRNWKNNPNQCFTASIMISLLLLLPLNLCCQLHVSQSVKWLPSAALVCFFSSFFFYYTPNSPIVGRTCSSCSQWVTHTTCRQNGTRDGHCDWPLDFFWRRRGGVCNQGP